MTEHEMAARIAELEHRLAGLLEMIESLPPTVARALELHLKWLEMEEGGVRLDLSGKNLSGGNFSNADLWAADFSVAKFTKANFSPDTSPEILSVASIEQNGIRNAYEGILLSRNLQVLEELNDPVVLDAMTVVIVSPGIAIRN